MDFFLAHALASALANTPHVICPKFKNKHFVGRRVARHHHCCGRRTMGKQQKTLATEQTTVSLKNPVGSTHI